MSWPTTAWTTGSLVNVSQLNAMPITIASATLGADAASISFTGLPSHYAHLQLKCYLRASGAGDYNYINLRFNGDSTGNYDYQYVYGEAASRIADEFFAVSGAFAGNITADTGGANQFAAVTINIPHYTNALNNKAFSSQWGRKFGTATTNLIVGRAAAFWRSNDAINQVQLIPAAGNLMAGSKVTIVGYP